MLTYEEQEIRTITGKLKLTNQTTETIIHKYRMSKKYAKLSGTRKGSILSAIIYHTSRKKRLKLTQKQVTTLTKISELSLRNILRKIYGAPELNNWIDN